MTFTDIGEIQGWKVRYKYIPKDAPGNGGLDAWRGVFFLYPKEGEGKKFTLELSDSALVGSWAASGNSLEQHIVSAFGDINTFFLKEGLRYLTSKSGQLSSLPDGINAVTLVSR